MLQEVMEMALTGIKQRGKITETGSLLLYFLIKTTYLVTKYVFDLYLRFLRR